MKKFGTFLLSIALLSANVFASYDYKLVPFTNSRGEADYTVKKVYYEDHSEDVAKSKVRLTTKTIVVDDVRHEVKEYNVDDKVYLYSIEDLCKMYNVFYETDTVDGKTTVIVDGSYSFSFDAHSNAIYPYYYSKKQIAEQEQKKNNKLVKDATDILGNSLKVAEVDGELYIQLTYSEFANKIR